MNVGSAAAIVQCHRRRLHLQENAFVLLGDGFKAALYGSELLQIAGGEVLHEADIKLRAVAAYQMYLFGKARQGSQIAQCPP